MHRVLGVAVLVVSGCGGSHPAKPDASSDAGPDAEPACHSQGVMGVFQRRAGNPRMLAGATFSDGKLDISIADPDVRWDAATQTYQLYYMAAHGATFSDPNLVQQIRHAASADHVAWTVDDAPALVANPVATAWDHVNTETPSVVYNPAAPQDRRYLLVYSGAAHPFPFAGYGFPEYAIGAAFSSDGVTFSRLPAAESPHAQDGLVLTGHDVFPSSMGAIVADPELVLVDGVYHLFFSSFACAGVMCETATDYGVGHATSADGIHWTTVEAPIRSLLRVSADHTSGGGQPSVIYDAYHCKWEMWLASDSQAEKDAQPVAFNNTAGVWHADSTDGMTWHISYTSARDLLWSDTAPGEHLGLLTGADVADNGDGRLMLFVGFDDQNVPTGFVLPDHTPTGFRPGVMTLDVATRDLP